MNRRDFIGASIAAAAATGATSAEPQDDATSAAPFELAYAPHFGMFRHSAGDDFVAQLDFMAAEGFRALEDNGMAGRS